LDKEIKSVKDILNKVELKNSLEELEKCFVDFLNIDEDNEELNDYTNEQKELVEEIIAHLINWVRENGLDEQKVEEGLYGLFNNKGLIVVLRDYLIANVSHYKAGDVLRNLWRAEPEKAKELIHFLFTHSLLRNSEIPMYKNELQELGIDDLDIYDTLVEYLKKLTTFCIEENLEEQSIKMLLHSMFDLDVELCEGLSKDIERNIIELKLNYIIRNLVQNREV